MRLTVSVMQLVSQAVDTKCEKTPRDHGIFISKVMAMPSNRRLAGILRAHTINTRPFFLSPFQARFIMTFFPLYQSSQMLTVWKICRSHQVQTPNSFLMKAIYVVCPGPRDRLSFSHISSRYLRDSHRASSTIIVPLKTSILSHVFFWY